MFCFRLFWCFACDYFGSCLCVFLSADVGCVNRLLVVVGFWKVNLLLVYDLVLRCLLVGF